VYDSLYLLHAAYYTIIRRVVVVELVSVGAAEVPRKLPRVTTP
jgi:hypothetical protein